MLRITKFGPSKAHHLLRWAKLSVPNWIHVRISATKDVEIQAGQQWVFTLNCCFLQSSPRFMCRKVKIILISHWRCIFSSLQQAIQGEISVIPSCSIPQGGHSPLEGPQKFTLMFRVLCLPAIILSPPWAGALSCLAQTETGAPSVTSLLHLQTGRWALFAFFTDLHLSMFILAKSLLINRKRSTLTLKAEFKIPPALPQMLRVALPVTAHRAKPLQLFAVKVSHYSSQEGWNCWMLQSAQGRKCCCGAYVKIH